MSKKHPPSDFAVIQTLELELELVTKIFAKCLWKLNEEQSVELKIAEHQNHHLFCYQSTEREVGRWQAFKTFYSFYVDEITNDNFEQIYQDFWKMIRFFPPNTTSYGNVLVYKKFLCDDVSLKYFCKQLPHCQSWSDVYQIDELKQLELVLPPGYTLK
jgi:hypothetical protein